MSTTSTPYVDAAYEHAHGHQEQVPASPGLWPLLTAEVALIQNTKGTRHGATQRQASTH
jgi:hypothetical protein